MILLSDTHLGVRRSGGTTPASGEALRSYVFSRFEDLLNINDDVVVLGDLFDGFTIDNRDFAETYRIISCWLREHPGFDMTLVAGNHDDSSRGNKLSSFNLLCSVLSSTFANVRVIGINEYEGIAPKVVALAHCSNQDVFDMKLKELLEKMREGQFLLLHANYDNNFAAVSDHSLNVSSEVARDFCNNGVTLVFAHEHQARTEIPHGTREGGGSVVVLGNQIATSVADCLGNDQKFYHRFDGDQLIRRTCWEAKGSFYRADWRNLADTPADAQFVRIEGEAKVSEAADVIDAVAKFRNAHDAFVVTNAVKVEGMADIADLPDQFEAAKKFDVMAVIKEHLDEDEFKVVAGLMED